jgi:hypothetical protein
MSQYHPVFPASLALDANENLYLAEPVHGCVLRLDVAGGRLSPVVVSTFDPRACGPAALSFGSDGTAWVLDSRLASVRAYEVRQDGLWQPLATELNRLNGQPLALGTGSAGIVCG